MTEEPEYMLEHNRIAAACCIKEAGIEVNVEEHHGHRASQHRHNGYKKIGGNQPCPDKHRHLHEGHAWSPHVQNGRDDVNTAHNGRGPHQVDGENKIGNRRRRIGCGEWCIERPSEVGTSTFHEQRRYHHAEGKWQYPE